MLQVGLRVATHRKGVFVSLVVPGSPAAMAGLRFGDQLLTLGSAELAGRTEDRVHGMLRSVMATFMSWYITELRPRSSPVNNIVLAVRDRPLCRSLVLTKDRAGRLGIMVRWGLEINSSDIHVNESINPPPVRDGAVSAIAVASTAARNGVLVGDQLVEVNGACVVGLGDREVRRRIEQEAAAVTLTTMPQETFRAMVRGMSGWLVRNKMNHSY